jgi:hypothetical protein
VHRRVRVEWVCVERVRVEWVCVERGVERAMRADRVFAAMRRYVLHPDEQVTERADLPDLLVVETGHARYEARPGRWRIREQPWVEDAVLVWSRLGPHVEFYYGLLLQGDGAELFLNDRATFARLGGLLGAGLDPLAYAELLATFYGDDQAGAPIVDTISTGALIREPEAFLTRYPAVDPALVSAPSVSRGAGDVTALDFLSYRRYLADAGPVIDLDAWRVTAPPGAPAGWSRRPVAQRLPVPRPARGRPGP